MSKYYCYDYYEDKDLRNKQIVYLYYYEEMSPSEIASIVGLANTTVSKYRRENQHLLAEVANLFTNKPPKNRDIEMPIVNLQFAKTKDTEKFYLIEILEASSGKLLASKVGTTIRPLRERMSEHRATYGKSYGVPVKIEVKRLYDCENVPAEYYESYFRSVYIAKHFGSFVKNDRFANVTFDYEEADKIFSKWKKNLG